MSEVKVSQLRRRTKAQLLEQLRDNKRELAALRVAQVTGGAPNKLAKIKTVRLNIARILTVMRQTQLQQLREVYKKRKYQPLDLREKKTRAIRRQLTRKEANAKTERQKKKEANFPRRKYALKAAA